MGQLTNIFLVSSDILCIARTAGNAAEAGEQTDNARDRSTVLDWSTLLNHYSLTGYCLTNNHWLLTWRWRHSRLLVVAAWWWLCVSSWRGCGIASWWRLSVSLRWCLTWWWRISSWWWLCVTWLWCHTLRWTTHKWLSLTVHLF